MEIIFDNLSSNNKKFNECSFKIEDGMFTAINGIDFKIFYELILMNKRPAKGSISVDDVVIKRSNKVLKYEKIIKKVGILSDIIFDEYNDCVVTDIFLDYFKRFKFKIDDVNKHIVDSLKLIGFNKSILKRQFDELSYTEKKKIMLCCVLAVNPSMIILDEFEKGLIFRDRELFKKLYIKLRSKFNKTIIFVNSKIDFVMGYVDKLIVINKGKKVYEGDKKSFYDDKIYKYLERPKIISFTKYVNSQGHDIIEYTDIKELLKELYRKIK